MPRRAADGDWAKGGVFLPLIGGDSMLSRIPEVAPDCFCWAVSAAHPRLPHPPMGIGAGDCHGGKCCLGWRAVVGDGQAGVGGRYLGWELGAWSWGAWELEGGGCSAGACPLGSFTLTCDVVVQSPSCGVGFCLSVCRSASVCRVRQTRSESPMCPRAAAGRPRRVSRPCLRQKGSAPVLLARSGERRWLPCHALPFRSARRAAGLSLFCHDLTPGQGHVEKNRRGAPDRFGAANHLACPSRCLFCNAPVLLPGCGQGWRAPAGTGDRGGKPGNCDARTWGSSVAGLGVSWRGRDRARIGSRDLTEPAS